MHPGQYLKRIGYAGSLDPVDGVLAALQKAHLLHVPFENLDIHLGRPIRLENSYDKVVLRHRGGFCYELNGLFYELLNILGFSVQRISARVYDQVSGRYGPEFDHMAIIATFGTVRYLSDVGFGEFAFAPLKIEPDTPQHDERGVFRIVMDGKDVYCVQKQGGPEFIPQYLFTILPREIHEFQDMCLYHQTSPESHFTQKPLCSIPTERGRVSITGDRLKITEHDKTLESVLEDPHAFATALWDHFRIRL